MWGGELQAPVLWIDVYVCMSSLCLRIMILILHGGRVFIPDGKWYFENVGLAEIVLKPPCYVSILGITAFRSCPIRQCVDLNNRHTHIDLEGLEPSWKRRVVSGEIPPTKLEKVSWPSRKAFRSYRISKWAGVFLGWLQSLLGDSSPGEGEFGVG